MRMSKQIPATINKIVSIFNYYLQGLKEPEANDDFGFLCFFRMGRSSPKANDIRCSHRSCVGLSSGIGDSDHAASKSGTGVPGWLAAIIGFGVNDDSSAQDRVVRSGD